MRILATVATTFCLVNVKNAFGVDRYLVLSMDCPVKTENTWKTPAIALATSVCFIIHEFVTSQERERNLYNIHVFMHFMHSVFASK